MQTLTYNASGQLASVTDATGRTLTFTYSGADLATMTDPAGGLSTYTWAANGTLTSVSYPDTKVRTYLYENTPYPKALTGIVDENGARYATWTYDAQGRATSSEHGATASGIDKASVTYNADGTATVTDARGTARNFTYTTQFGVAKLAGSSQPCPTCGGSDVASTTYDANGFISSKVDFNGNRTNYTYDGRGLETSRTEAAGTALARTVSTTWHPSFRLPTQIAEPGRATDFTYDAAGNLTQRKVTAGANTRLWNSTYNANGQLLTLDGPRTDVSDVTTYAYNTSANLTSITNALGHVTNITSYDAHGRPLSLTDPNGLITTLVYDLRGRLTSRNVGGETTTYTYDGVGQLTKVTLPNAAFLTYTYDAAHRLTQIQDQLGNKIVYTLDLLGNRTGESVYDPAAVLRQTRSRIFDSLNRLQKDIGGASPSTEITQYGYDANGNLATVTDPLNHVTSNAYDTLNRLTQVTDPALGLTRYGYTALDQLASVTDPRNLATTYTIDGLDNTSQIASPDTGTTINTFDAAGNVATSKDAKNQTTSYQYDALNRLTLITYADATTRAYQYDAGVNQKGRLTRVTDPSGSTAYTYNSKSRLTQKTQVTGAVTLTTKYAYDATGQLTSLTYPTNLVVAYTWTSGQITTIKRGTVTAASSIVYHPFGPPTSWTAGNGQVITRTFDLDGRMAGNPLGSLSFDAASRITAAYGKTYGYDGLDRLTSFNDGAAGTYGYDPTGNRVSQSIAGTSTSFAIAATSNRIASSTTGGITKTYAFDANGSQTADGSNTFAYNAAGRLITAATGAYTYNGLGQRVKKVAGSVTRLFVYDEAGHIIGEYDGAGTRIEETTWLGDIPLTVSTPAATNFVHADHLNAPRRIYNPSAQLIWQWDNTAFGTNLPNENPSGLGVFSYNLRLPGQYYDSETGNHYNYYRDYDPRTGRYIESDPIGLRGSINTYNYVENSPVAKIDPSGLTSDDPLGLGGSARPPVGFPDVTSQAQIELAKRITKLFCDPSCWELKQKIDQLKGEIRKRYVQATADKNGTFNNNFFGSLGWFNHKVTFKGYQLGLRRALEQARAQGCPPDQEGEELASIDFPESPAR